MRVLICFLCLLVGGLSWGQIQPEAQKVPVVHAKRRALIIGANDYQYLGKLAYPSSDASRFRKLLVDNLRFTDNSIRFLSDREPSAKPPTSANISEAMDSLLSDPALDKGDLFILYFSGHGMGIPQGDYLCATDSKPDDVDRTGIPVGPLIQRLVDAKLRNVLIIADACRAGEKNSFGRQLSDLAKKANIAVILGCEPGKKSYESAQLKSGVFTYFLLKSLVNPKTRTEVGGLWASRVAASLTDSVFQFTEHDYGVNAQRPTSFADPTSDVLVARYVDAKDVANLGVDAQMTTSPAKAADALVAMTGDLLQQNKMDVLLEVNKVALSLDSTNLYAAYYAAVACQELGRTGEQEKFCDMLKKSEDAYFRNFGYVISDSRTTAIDDRVKYLEKYWEASSKEEIHAVLVWARARAFAPSESITRLVKKMLPDIKPQTRLYEFFQGEVSSAAQKPAEALGHFQAALMAKEPDSMVSNDIIVVFQMAILFELRKPDELKALLRDQFDHDTVAPMIWSSAAMYLKALGNREAALAIVKKGLKEPNLQPAIVVLACTAAGTDIVSLVDDLDAQVKMQPFSWQIRTAALIARGVRDKDANATALAFEEANKYCDDELEIISLTYQINSSILKDGKAQHPELAAKADEVYAMFRLLFETKAASIGTDSEKWIQLGDLGLSVLQAPAVLKVFKSNLKSYDAAAAYGSEFYSILFQLATSMDDDEIIEKAVHHPDLIEPTRSDVMIQYAAYLVSRGKYEEAQRVNVATPVCSEPLKIVKSALDAIAKSRKGDSTALKAFLAQEFSVVSEPLVARGIAAMALADAGDTETALPHLEFFTKMQPTTVVSVPYRCIQRYLNILRAQGKQALADEKLFEALLVNTVSPGIADSYFGAKPNVANFVGSFKAKETHWFSDELFDDSNPTHKNAYLAGAIGDGSMEITIAADGKLTGFMQIKDGERFELVGQVDALGNLRGQATNAKHKLTMFAKMVSRDFMKTETFQKSSVGQLIQFYDEQGIACSWYLPYSVTNGAGG